MIPSEFDRFHNALRILLNIDQHELVSAGVLISGDREAWEDFRADPFRWFIRAGDADAAKVWAMIAARQPNGEIVILEPVSAERLAELKSVWRGFAPGRVGMVAEAGPDIMAALRRAREFVAMNVEELLASCCVTGDDGKPDRSTIDHMDRGAVDDAEDALAQIDAAIAQASIPTSQPIPTEAVP